MRELRADLRRIESAPYPSSSAKAQMRAQIEALAMQGAPSVSGIVEHDGGKIAWPTQSVRAEIYNTGLPAVGFCEVPDAVALLAWLHRDLLIKRLDAEIATESDDAASLSHEARQQREAEVQSDLLAVERDEASLVWSAQSQNLPTEHRSDISPIALLGVTLVVAPADGPRGGSFEHIVEFAQPGRL